jgi:hypothetical protein
MVDRGDAADHDAVVAVIGSVTPPGRLRRALAEALDRSPEATSLIDLAERRIAFADGRPPEALGDDTAATVAAIAAADAVILATPTYRGSLTGAVRLLSLGRISCEGASNRLAAFLQDFDGKLPNGWRLDPETATFTRRGSTNYGFRIKPAATPQPVPAGGGGTVYPAGRACPGTSGSCTTTASARSGSRRAATASRSGRPGARAAPRRRVTSPGSSTIRAAICRTPGARTPPTVRSRHAPASVSGSSRSASSRDL